MSQPLDIRYRITPSLLNSYQRYLDLDVEAFWWQDENGGWHRNLNEETGEMHFTPTEVDDMACKALIDTINRVPFVSEASSKGTAFNEVVDSFITRKRSDKVTMRGDRDTDTIMAEVDGFTFGFSFGFAEEVARYFAGSECQVEVHAPIETRYGMVELYGYIDYLRGNHVYDMKTTKNYTFGDHEKGWQKYLYPYALIESGMVTEVQDFEYTIYKWTGGTKTNPNLSGVQYREVYTYDHEHARERLTGLCESFIGFLELHRKEITDRKVFGGLEH